MKIQICTNVILAGVIRVGEEDFSIYVYLSASSNLSSSFAAPGESDPQQLLGVFSLLSKHYP